jgi:hypothetical protein
MNIEYKNNSDRLFKNGNEIIEMNKEIKMINENIDNKLEKQIVSKKKNIKNITI